MRRNTSQHAALIAAIAVALGAAAYVRAAAPGLTNAGTTYAQDFASLPNQNAGGTPTATWADDANLAGWYAQNLAGTAATPTSIIANNGGNFTGIQSIGSNLNSATDLDTSGLDRAFGTRNSQGTGDIRYGLVLRNTGVTEITSITVNYVGEQWRQDVNTTGLATAPANDKLDFAYKLSANQPDSTNALSGTFTDVDALDFVSVKPLLTSGSATRLDGNAAANRAALTATISGISIAPNAFVVLRWYDPNTLTTTGSAVNDNSLAIDDLNVSAAYAAAVWKTDADGDWQTAANWNANFVPSASNLNVILGSAAIAPRTISLTAATTVGQINFNNANAYTLNGAGSLAFDAPSARSITVAAGQHTIAVPVTSSGPLAVSVAQNASVSLTAGLSLGASTLTKSGAGELRIGGSLTGTGVASIAAGKLTLAGASADALLGGTSISASLDAIGSRLSLDFASATSSEATLIAKLASGLASGFTTGPIRTALLTSARSVGYASSGTNRFDVAVALKGDFNLDGTVNFDDLLRLASNYNVTSNVSWPQGDANYDGAVNFDDLLVLAANYNSTLSGSLGGDWALAQAAVPEPATLLAAQTLIALALARPKGVIRRRRR
jgi:hypothetical protein